MIGTIVISRFENGTSSWSIIFKSRSMLSSASMMIKEFVPVYALIKPSPETSCETICCTSWALTYFKETRRVTTDEEGFSMRSFVRVGMVDCLASLAGTIFHRLSLIGTVLKPFNARTESRMRRASSEETFPGRYIDTFPRTFSSRM